VTYRYTPEGLAAKSRASIASNKRRAADPEAMRRMGDKLRGFSVPDHLLDTYRLFIHTKRIPAKEAARMLGIPT
jgi:hypothetical protein